MVILIKLILNKTFLVTIIRRKQFLQEIFTKKKIDKNIPYVVADEFVSIRDVLKSYLITFQGFFRLIRYIKKNKKIFYIKKKNCRSILEPLLLSSFSGEIQSQILIGLGIKNF